LVLFIGQSRRAITLKDFAYLFAVIPCYSVCCRTFNILEPYTAAEYTAAVHDFRTFGHNHNHNHIFRCSDALMVPNRTIYENTETGHWT
jgi:hypothetical protein